MERTVIENSAEHRFEMPVTEYAMAAIYYRIEDGRVVLTHTEVPFEYSGQGLGTRLAIGTMELIRNSGRKAVLRCPFLETFLSAHPEYAELIER